MRKFEAIRTEIKRLSVEQKLLKPQRKPSYTGIIHTGCHSRNRYELRHLFQAYAILKGVERQEVKKPSNYNGLVIDQRKIDEMVEKYKPVEETVQ